MRLFESWLIALLYNHKLFLVRDNTGKSDLANPNINLISRGADGGGSTQPGSRAPTSTSPGHSNRGAVRPRTSKSCLMLRQELLAITHSTQTRTLNVLAQRWHGQCNGAGSPTAKVQTMLSKLIPISHPAFVVCIAFSGACTDSPTKSGTSGAEAVSEVRDASQDAAPVKAGDHTPSKDPAGAGGRGEVAENSARSAGAGGGAKRNAKESRGDTPAADNGGTGGTAADGGASAAERAGPAGGGAHRVTTCNEITKLDLLFVVDNSNSMAGEQQSLKQQFPNIVQALANGKRPGAAVKSFPPVKDLHVGVVSTDMGIPGVEFPSGHCRADGGDDGKLQTLPHGDACAPSYPLFLTYSGDAQVGQQTDAAKFVDDVACIATLGTGGCGFEQQLEAPFKALWPKLQKDAAGKVISPNEFKFLASTEPGSWGKGDVPAAMGGNEGFLRNETDPSGPSLIAIVLLTDEEDCSVLNTEHLQPNNQLAEDSPYRTEDINLRCYNHKEFLYNVQERYFAGLRKLRPGHEERVIFTAITGVPPDLVDETARAKIDFSSDDASARDAFYDAILNDPRMQEALDPATNPGSGQGNLVPSCSREVPGETYPSTAYPPRRIVQLAKLFGKNGMVQSICQDDLSSASAAIVDTLARRLDRPCH